MADTQLIVSNPPHGDVDTATVAPLLDCSTAEARIKVNFPAPEIWAVEAEKSTAGEATKRLLDAGARVAWIPGSVLAAAPRASIGSAIAIENDQVVITTRTGELIVNSGDQVVVVVGEPVQQDSRPSSETASILTQKVRGRGAVRNMPLATGVATGVAGVAGYKAVSKLDKIAEEARDAAETRLSDKRTATPTELFLDIYAFSKDGWQSARIAPSLTDFSGLGDRKQPTAKANIGAIVDVLKAHFGARVDERLMKVSYKTSIVSGMAVNQVLGAISEDIASLSMLEIGSQLAFLTSKG